MSIWSFPDNNEWIKLVWDIAGFKRSALSVLELQLGTVVFHVSEKMLLQDPMNGKNGFGALCWRLKGNLENISGAAPCSLQYLD